MIEHQLGHLLAINKHDGGLNIVGVRAGICRKARGGDEHAFSRTLALKCACKPLNVWSADAVLPALCLDIDGVETESIFLDNSVDALVAGTAYNSRSILARSAVSHRHKQIDYKFFKELGANLAHS